MANDLVLLIEKFVEDNAELMNFTKNDVETWALRSINPYYSSKYYFFFKNLRLLLNENANKIFSFNWGRIKVFFKDDSKKYDELLSKHRKANKL